jgi:hypothetical protein
MHPDNESITRWIAEINKLDDPSYHNQVVQRQKEFMASIPYSELFDELNSKMQDAIRDFRRV